MKIIAILTLILIITSSLYAVSDQQNKLNISYLDDLDLKLVDSIDLIIAFNKTAENMKGYIEGAEDFSEYLLALTMEISTLRKMIQQSQDLDPDQREITIRKIMEEMQPERIKVKENIDNDLDKQNSKYLEQRLVKLSQQLISYKTEIMKEENIISESQKISQNYLGTHNRHFVYHLLYCFALDYSILSKTNRQFLVDLITAVDMNIYKQKL
ncbi:MAG: hypothetical protein RAO94_01370 [Candidatus Stygibacter australis]|nr:hypothetical protein [Candidatus Stygibacter australis]